MGKAASKRKPPSRLRYEQSHPTVSCRVSRIIYDRMKKVKKTQGKSFSDILKIGLGVLEVQAKNEAELTKQGYNRGYNKRYADAELLFNITYPCDVCGKTITATSKDEKEAIRRYMQEHRWGHGECHERKR